MNPVETADRMSSWLAQMAARIGESLRIFFSQDAGIWLQILPFAFILLLFLAALGLMPITAGFLCGGKQRKAMRGLCARHLIQLCNTSNWLWLIVGTAGLFSIYLVDPQKNIPLLTVCLFLAIFALTAVLLVWIMAIAEKSFKEQKGFQLLLLFLSGGCLLFTGSSAFLLASYTAAGCGIPKQINAPTLINAAIAIAPEIWIALAAFIPVSLASAGGIALLWFAVRRNKDDYGRDYYAYASSSCAKIASWAAWIACVLCIGLGIRMYMQGALQTVSVRNLWLIGGIFGPLVLSALLWSFVAKGENPMRKKFSFAAAVLFMMASLTSALQLLF